MIKYEKSDTLMAISASFIVQVNGEGLEDRQNDTLRKFTSMIAL
jgi:hypothetical protein